MSEPRPVEPIIHASHLSAGSNPAEKAAVTDSDKSSKAFDLEHEKPKHGSPLELEKQAHHRRLLRVLSFAATLLTLFFTITVSQLPLFDASPSVLLPAPRPEDASLAVRIRHVLASSVLRWDAFHFAHIATANYVYEHEWAFFPGIRAVMRDLGHIVSFLFDCDYDVSVGVNPKLENALLGGLLGALPTAFSVVTLYDLSLEHLGSSDAAFLAALLSLLPSSPVTLRVSGYTEPFFTFFSYQGMLHCAHGNWITATLSFIIASAFRSNGIFLSGFLVWGLVVEPLLDRRKLSLGSVPYAAALSLLTCAPFLYHQYAAYLIFCTRISNPAPWCESLPPFIYNYVQAKYWNIGFLRYWTVQQLPNFLLGAPPLILLFSFTVHYLRHAVVPRLRLLALELTSPGGKVAAHKRSLSPSHQLPSSSSPFLRPSIAPHAIHTLALALLLLFASHTQIVLRLAAGMPLTYWAAAWLLVERPHAGRLWVGWSVVWGAISCVLWGAFLPPA
ncbi:GPI mannosyltransferase 2 [Fomes fomentarius]|nr:GPI mannosyltransferase 2 [Fomes fomentarius]